MMNLSLEMLFGVCLEKESGLGVKKFSLDELIIRTRECFEDRGLALFMEVIIKSVEEYLLAGLVGKFIDPRPVLKALSIAPCCPHSNFTSKGLAERSIMTSLGDMELCFKRIKCVACSATIVPMRDFLGIKPFQNKSNELLKICIEAVTDQSYRRSLYQIEELTGADLSLGSLWRSLMKNKNFILNEKTVFSELNLQTVLDESIRESIKTDPIHAILADGTGFKLQREEENLKKSDSKLETKSNLLQSEVRVIFGITKLGSILPLGVYGGQETWKFIGRDLYRRFGKNPKLKPEPIAEILLADGEEAIFEHLGKLAKEQQRCQWHLTHDFKVVFQYLDDGKKEERKIYQSQIHEAMNIEVDPKTHEDLEKKLLLEAEIKKAEKTLNELAVKLDENSYHKSAGYLRNAAYKMFTYLRVYIRTGILGAKVTSRLERLMREIGRRIKRIAFNWSPRGVALMCYMILIRAMNKNLWNKYWEKVLNVSGSIKLNLKAAFMRNQEVPLPN